MREATADAANDLNAGTSTGLSLAGVAQFLLFLLIFSVAFMKPPVRLFGFLAVPPDFLFLAVAAVAALAVATGRIRLGWSSTFPVLALYFGALALSALASDQPMRSAVKLATQLYLLALPFLVVQLVRSRDDLRRALSWWLAGAAVVAAVGVASLVVFLFDPDNVLLDYTRFHFGTLPPGDYPRLSLTFLNANMACNYLVVSLGVLLVAQRLGWVSTGRTIALAIALLVCAASTISPGLGGVALLLGIWFWLVLRERHRWVGRLALAGGLAGAALFVVAMAVTPILHPTAPFLIRIPGLDITLAPAGRLMIWMDAARNFLADPLLGRGIGSEAVDVRYMSPSGYLQQLTDAHNVYLNIAVQAGIIGLAALLALIVHVWRATLPLRFLAGDINVARLGLGLAFLNGFAYQGLGGSYEDVRHLWILLGLFLASRRIEALGAHRGGFARPGG